MLAQEDNYVTRINTALGTDVWVGFSHYLDSTWSVADYINNPELIWQWHGEGGRQGGPAGGTDPPLSMFVLGSNAIVYLVASSTVYGSGLSPPYVPLVTIPISTLQNKWTDWVVRYNPSYTSGIVQIWMKNATDSSWTKIVDYSGSTIYAHTDQTTQVGPYWDFGPYKWDWGTTATLVSRRTIWFDEIRFGDSTASMSTVLPGQ